MHLLTKPFKTRAAALKYSKSMLLRAIPDDDRVIAIPGGFAALFSTAPLATAVGSERDVFHGVKGAATRRQLV